MTNTNESRQNLLYSPKLKEIKTGVSIMFGFWTDIILWWKQLLMDYLLLQLSREYNSQNKQKFKEQTILTKLEASDYIKYIVIETV